MTNPTVPQKSSAAWHDALLRSEAQLAAGMVVPGDEVMSELREAIVRVESKGSAALKRKAQPHR